jgi:hypothetical protein
MAPFRAESRGVAGFETALGQIAEGDPPTTQDRQRFLQSTQLAVEVADAIESHDPGFQRNDWKRFAAQMRRSGRDMAEALAHHDRQATRIAARQLAMTCQACHATFRP